MSAFVRFNLHSVDDDDNVDDGVDDDDDNDESSYMRPWCSHRFGEEAMWSSWRIEGTL